MIKLKTKYDFRTFKYFNYLTLKYNKKIHIWYLVLAIFALGGLVYTTFIMPNNLYVSLTTNAEKPSFLFPVVFLLIVIYLIWQIFNIEKRLDTQLIRMLGKRKPIEFIVELDADEIRIFDAEKQDEEPLTKYPWAYITSVNEIPEYYFLMSGKRPIVIDRREEMIIEGTKEELDIIIKENSIAKPYKRFDNFVLKGRTDLEYKEVVAEPIVAEEAKSTESNTEEAVIEEVEIPAAVIEEPVIEEAVIPEAEVAESATAEAVSEEVKVEAAPVVKKTTSTAAKKPAAKKTTTTAKKTSTAKKTTTAKKTSTTKKTTSTAEKTTTAKKTTSTAAKKPAAKKTTTTAKKTSTTKASK